MQKRLAFGLVMVLASLGTTAGAQKSACAASPPLPSLPVTLFTSELAVRVTAVATGLSHPWSLAFPPDSALLVTERSGRLRLIRHGVLDPKPVEGVPAVYMPQIYSLGHRSPQGLTVHPATGAIWETEHGPLYGDEINIIKPACEPGRIHAGTARSRIHVAVEPAP